MFSEFDITTAKWGEVEKMKHYDMAILPWGATEPHNKHLPYCTDMLTAQAVAFEVAGRAAAGGIGVMVLPGIPLGSQNPGQVQLPYCIHTTQATQMAILRDIVTSLKRQGIHKLLIVSGHGGNVFKGMIRDIMIDNPEMYICHSEWYSFVNRKDFFEEETDDHAGELETSVMLHYYPELVRMDLAGEGKSRGFAIEGLNEGVAWLPRDWSRVTTDTGIGCPFKASAEKGERFIEAVLPKLTKFVVDFAKGDVY